MKIIIEVDRDHFRIGTEDHFNIIYLWWGLDPWGDFDPEGPKRIYEIGFGSWSKRLFT